MFASPPVHWKLSPSIAWEAEEDRSMAFSCSSLVLCVSHCCRNIGKVKSHSQLLERFLSPQCLLPCNTVASIEFPVQDIIDELQQVQSRLVWAGAKGQRHLGWLGWTRDGFMQKSTKVTSNTCREVFKKIIPGSSQCCLVWQETAGWKGRGSRVRLQPGYDRDFFPMKTSKQVVRTVHLPSIRREFHDWTR